MSSDATFLCSCGSFHPVGFICGNSGFGQVRNKKAAVPECSHEPEHEELCAEPASEHNSHAHALDCTVDMKAVSAEQPGLEQTPAIQTVYHIANMDCPLEETLIRKKLATVPGIIALEFNLMQRLLTVRHVLSDTKSIESALESIAMTAEPIYENQGTVAVFSINGMDCPVEENLIRRKLAAMPGVLSFRFNLMQRTLQVQHEPSALSAISAALNSLDMDAKLLTTQAETPAVSSEPKIPWKKLAAAGVFAALSEGFELIHEWGAGPLGMDLSTWNIGGYAVLDYLPLIFAVIAIALGGLTTYKKGWLAVSNFNLNINALMSVAVTGAVIIGQYPEAAMVMVLFNLSEAIEAKALDKARNAIKGLLALAPDTATVLQPDGTWEETDIRKVSIGSRVRVKPGEKIALDGIVLTGQSTVNQAPITGESMPVEKKAGDTVYAGTINETGSFEFEATAAATDSTLARIIHAVEEAQGSRAPMQRFVDTFARYYTPAVFLTSVLAGVIPPLFMAAEWLPSVYTALVILVIGCPCALVISTPVSIVSGMAAATRYGILIKGGMFLEQGRLLKWLALDKTGTITYGKPRQTDFVRVGEMPKRDIIELAAGLAARSDHPVSKAVAQAAMESGVQPKAVEVIEAIPGRGVSGIVSGKKWYLGNYRLVKELKQNSSQIEEQIFSLERQGKTVVALIGRKGIQGLFAVADTVKESSFEAVKELKKLGVKTIMLTGDNEHTAEAIARQVGVSDFRANLLPEDKLSIIEQLEQRGEKVGMVGDGINDAPALAKAHVGFAMAGSGTDTAIETADVALMDDDLRKVPRFIRLSRATYAILVQNIILALSVKALFFTLTFTGNATMWLAVFADVGTALLVVANGLRAMRK